MLGTHAKLCLAPTGNYPVLEERMRITLDFALGDCIIVKSLDDEDMSLTYSTPVGDFVLTISRGDAVVEWNGIIPAPDNIIPQAEKLLKTLGWYW